MFKYSVPISQKITAFSIIKINRLILSREISDVSCENRIKHVQNTRGQNEIMLLIVK
jgi:hypothetical protein